MVPSSHSCGVLGGGASGTAADPAPHPCGCSELVSFGGVERRLRLRRASGMVRGASSLDDRAARSLV
ncbi:hypothetical protein PVAP13_9NG335573 [Panicum virgatum]|uniref:Uncharacterized protein n=1 Tax=Panicum virgatum TaxID=38727 RepID=A0A8T0MQU5_PANVG|nr:hypothetical protein PVAP13_9NG270146 [Panicum virgatum]KAG2537769.1 hypothetical protein PVAP13_9NG335573 [Panicum virgatum]